MWTQIKADMIFKGDKFKTPQHTETLIATDDPTITGHGTNMSVYIKAVTASNKRWAHVKVPYGTNLIVWTQDK